MKAKDADARPDQKELPNSTTRNVPVSDDADARPGERDPDAEILPESTTTDDDDARFEPDAN